MNIVCITQARLGSSRLPNKVLLPLGGKTVLDLHLKRVKKSKLISHFVVATTNEPGSEKICKIAEDNGFYSYQGSVDDVLERYYLVAKKYNADVVVRVTSDCPLIDPLLIDDLISKFLGSNADYISNCLQPNLPDGMDCEAFKFSSLENAFLNAKLKSEREHVTAFIWKNSDFSNGTLFKAIALNYNLNLDKIRMTLDYESDYNFLKKLVEVAGEEATLDMYLNVLRSAPELGDLNNTHTRNEGYQISLRKD